MIGSLAPESSALGLAPDGSGGAAPWLLAGARLVTADRAEIGRYAAEQGSRLDAGQGLLILGGLILLISAAALTAWVIRRRPPLPVVILFNRLAREAGLKLGDRWLLYRVARGRGPAAVLAPLLCPTTLGAWAREHARAGPAPRQRRAAGLARAASIRRRLFGPAAASASRPPFPQEL